MSTTTQLNFSAGALNSFIFSSLFGRIFAISVCTNYQLYTREYQTRIDRKEGKQTVTALTQTWSDISVLSGFRLNGRREPDETEIVLGGAIQVEE